MVFPFEIVRRDQRWFDAGGLKLRGQLMLLSIGGPICFFVVIGAIYWWLRD